MILSLFWQLFSTFFVIGLFNFGGGAAMLSLIQNEVVNSHAWLTESEFTDIVAISQSTPGPVGINCATYVGFEVFHDAGYGSAVSIFGSAAATLAIVLPSFLVFYGIIRIVDRFHTSPVFIGTMKALKPVVAGMIAAAALILIFNIDFDGLRPSISVIGENFPDWLSWAMFAAAFILSYTKKAGPIPLLLAAGVIGLIVYL